MAKSQRKTKRDCVKIEKCNVDVAFTRILVWNPIAHSYFWEHSIFCECGAKLLADHYRTHWNTRKQRFVFEEKP